MGAAADVDWWKRFDKSELAASLLVIALGAFVMWHAAAWEYMTPDGPGPGFFPLWIGGALIVLPVVLTAAQLFDIRRGLAAARIRWEGASRVLAGWAAFVAAAALLRPAGFVVTLALLCAFYVRVIYRRSWITALAVSSGSAAGFWIVFVKLLGLQMPTGPWGF